MGIVGDRNSQEPAADLARLLNKTFNTDISVKELESFIWHHWNYIATLAHMIRDEKPESAASDKS